MRNKLEILRELENLQKEEKYCKEALEKIPNRIKELNKELGILQEKKPTLSLVTTFEEEEYKDIIIKRREVVYIVPKDLQQPVQNLLIRFLEPGFQAMEFNTAHQIETIGVFKEYKDLEYMLCSRYGLSEVVLSIPEESRYLELVRWCHEKIYQEDSKKL